MNLKITRLLAVGFLVCPLAATAATVSYGNPATFNFSLPDTPTWSVYYLDVRATGLDIDEYMDGQVFAGFGAQGGNYGGFGGTLTPAEVLQLPWYIYPTFSNGFSWRIGAMGAPTSTFNLNPCVRVGSPTAACIEPTTATVPEPGTLALLGLGLAGLGLSRRRKTD